jgi:hypothetical protein
MESTLPRHCEATPLATSVDSRTLRLGSWSTKKHIRAWNITKQPKRLFDQLTTAKLALVLVTVEVTALTIFAVITLSRILKCNGNNAVYDLLLRNLRTIKSVHVKIYKIQTAINWFRSKCIYLIQLLYGFRVWMAWSKHVFRPIRARVIYMLFYLYLY